MKFLLIDTREKPKAIHNILAEEFNADRKTEPFAKDINVRSKDEPQTYITEDRDTQILDAWQVHHRSTTSVEDEPQTSTISEDNSTISEKVQLKDEPQTDCPWK